MSKNSAGCRVSVLIFTLDEEINLPHCLATLQWCNDIIVIDSGSIDGTTQIAEAAGAKVFYRAFDGFGSQRNWAIQNAGPKYDWLFILDADERFTDALAEEINKLAVNSDSSVAGARVRRRFYMWGKWLKFSSLYPTWVVRLVHKDRVQYVNRGHAETQEARGTIVSLENDLLDENHKGLDHWYKRQEKYAENDAEFELESSADGLVIGELFSRDPLVRKMAQKRLSWRLPCRPIIYFIYSYLWRGGFLDGVAGLRFCSMRSEYQSMVVKHKARLARNR